MSGETREEAVEEGALEHPPMAAVANLDVDAGESSGVPHRWEGWYGDGNIDAGDTGAETPLLRTLLSPPVPHAL